MTATPAPPPPPPPAPPAPSTATGLTCPACGASAPAGTRFCPACGASLTTGSSASGGSAASTGSPPVDIRQTVDTDRGILKRLQLMVPGFRGYRQAEDIRIADSLLRTQVAGLVDRTLASLQGTRATMSRLNQYQGLTDLATILSDLQVLAGQIRHAEQGYAGISANVRVTPARLDQLYEYDYGFIQAADQLAAGAAPIQDASAKGDVGALRVTIQDLRNQVQVLQNAFTQRLRAVEGIMVQ